MRVELEGERESIQGKLREQEVVMQEALLSQCARYSWCVCRTHAHSQTHTHTHTHTHKCVRAQYRARGLKLLVYEALSY